MIDCIDLKILSLLQENARMSNAEIARRVGKAPSAVLERIRKLEQRGVIKGYSARLCPVAVGVGLLAFVLVRTDDRVWQPQTGEQLARIPEIAEVHHIAGEDCFLVKIRARDTSALAHILRDRLGQIDTVKTTRTTIVLESVKETNCVPLTGAQELSTR